MLTQFQGEVDALVHVLGPDVVGGLVVEDGLDAAVHVALACGHLVTGDGHDEGAGPVPGQHVSRPVGDRRDGSDTPE